MISRVSRRPETALPSSSVGLITMPRENTVISAMTYAAASHSFTTPFAVATTNGTARARPRVTTGTRVQSTLAGVEANIRGRDGASGVRRYGCGLLAIAPQADRVTRGRCGGH